MRIGAIDQGTTSTRILVADETGARVAASFMHETRYPNPGWVEQDALEIAGHIEKCVAAASPLDALGLTNQGESCLAWDAVTKDPLTPIIVWQDSRTAAELSALPADVTARITALSSLPADAYFSASKLGWIMRNVRAARDAHAHGRLRLGTTDAFYLDRLAGCFATDRATASRTSLMNMRRGDWDAELCAIFGVPMECLPPIHPNISAFGAIGGIQVSASIVDQQAALYGHGCRAPGDLKITFGTGAFALALSDGAVAPADANGLLPTVAWDLGQGIRYALDGGVYDVGSAINWAIRAGLADGLADFQHFESATAISRDLVFVPAFSGLAAPHWDRRAAPLIVGMSSDTTRRDLCQALLEGIALSTAAVIEAMGDSVSHTQPISIDGGVSQSPYFAQFLADCLGREVLVRRFPEQTALGVALLASGETGLALPADFTAGDMFRPHTVDAAHYRQRHAEACSRAAAWRTPVG